MKIVEYRLTILVDSKETITFTYTSSYDFNKLLNYLMEQGCDIKISTKLEKEESDE